MGEETRDYAVIVVAGSRPARACVPLRKTGSLCRDRASSPLSSPRRRRHGRPAIKQESGGVWGWPDRLSIRAGRAACEERDGRIGPGPKTTKIALHRPEWPRFGDKSTL